ncbi:M15 family metallopeptidase [Rickettsiales bacterium]|nr:M15 family metallopeptidase [Rickettsiales bacterium]
MPKFSNRSKDKLITCHPKLQELFNIVIKNYDCTIIEGRRSNERQEELFHQGKSKLKAGKSKHNQAPSLAVDVAPYPINWNDRIKFYHFVGYVKATADQLKIKIRCGADWDNDNDLHDQTFFDLPHFELITD